MMFNNILSILSAYNWPPTDISTIPELEEICRERIALYCILSADKLGKGEKYNECNYIKHKAQETNLRTYFRILDGRFTEKDRQRNWKAHWLMAMFFCQPNYMQEYFIKSELAWFNTLYPLCRHTDIDQFIKDMGCKLGSVTGKDCPFLLDYFDNNQNLYHTPFQEAPLEFLRDGLAVLHKGHAYFPEQLFETYLRHRLKVKWLKCCDRFAEMAPDFPDNVKYIFTSLTDNLPGLIPLENNSSSSDICSVNLENIDDYASNHYPLCMRFIHDVLRTNHHLKYDCKMQYGVFLKHIGFPFEDAMSFWREEFTKVIPEQRYNKKYEYLFKHQYGKVGYKNQYPPPSCNKIQESQPMRDQYHGCPFKHWDMGTLKCELSKEGITGSNLIDIEDLVKKKEYSHACERYFCIKHHVLNVEKQIDSPNGYFNQSVQLDLIFDS